MASHQVAIAKASFAAGLLRPDPVSVGRDELNRFHKLLDAAIVQCSPVNIQKCKVWILGNVIPSSGRIAALGKYLAALSFSFGTPTEKPRQSTGLLLSEKPSAKRKSLHALYLLNDVLHHTKFHADTNTPYASLASNLQPQLVSLVSSASRFDPAKHPRQLQRVEGLLNTWADYGYYGRDYIHKLHEAVKNAGDAESADHDVAKTDEHDQTVASAAKGRSDRDAPYIMPATHGDISTPYYDLPAGNMMPHIIPNSTSPIQPQLVKPLQFVAGPADESLAKAVREFLKDVDKIYSDSLPFGEDTVMDFDEMGQPLVEDEMTGKLVATEGYYGWSVDFCESMKKRPHDDSGRGADRRRMSPSRSSSGSDDSRRRRRRSSSTNSGSHHRGFGSARRSRSRSLSTHGAASSHRRQDHRSRSPRHSRPNERSPPARFQDGPVTAPLPPPRFLGAAPVRQTSLLTPADQIDNPFTTPLPPAPVAPPASAFNHNFPLGPGGLPIPPPPPFHKGPWPPPPPNLPAGMQYNPGQAPQLATMQFVPPPPPQDARHGWPGREMASEGSSHSVLGQGPALGTAWSPADSQRNTEQHQKYGNGRTGQSGNWQQGQDPRRR